MPNNYPPKQFRNHTVRSRAIYAPVTQLTARPHPLRKAAQARGIKITRGQATSPSSKFSPPNPPPPPPPFALPGGGRRPAAEAHLPAVMEKGCLGLKVGGGKMRGAAGLMGLQKQNSWSPDIERDVAWERRRRGLQRGSTLRRGRSVTDDDLDELRGCIDLGFGFEAAGCAVCGAPSRSRLVQTLPALDLYYAVAAGGSEGCVSPCSCGASSQVSSEESPIGSPLSILSPGDPPETVKMRLKQWAQVVALSLRNRS